MKRLTQADIDRAKSQHNDKLRKRKANKVARRSRSKNHK